MWLYRGGIWKQLAVVLVGNNLNTEILLVSQLRTTRQKKLFPEEHFAKTPTNAMLAFSKNFTKNIILYKKCAQLVLLHDTIKTMLTFPSEKAEDDNSNKYQDHNTTNHPTCYRSSI